VWCAGGIKQIALDLQCIAYGCRSQHRMWLARYLTNCARHRRPGTSARHCQCCRLSPPRSRVTSRRSTPPSPSSPTDPPAGLGSCRKGCSPEPPGFAWICGRFVWICGRFAWICGRFAWICGRFAWICGRLFAGGSRGFAGGFLRAVRVDLRAVRVDLRVGFSGRVRVRVCRERMDDGRLGPSCMRIVYAVLPQHLSLPNKNRIGTAHPDSLLKKQTLLYAVAC